MIYLRVRLLFTFRIVSEKAISVFIDDKKRDAGGVGSFIFQRCCAIGADLIDQVSASVKNLR